MATHEMERLEPGTVIAVRHFDLGQKKGAVILKVGAPRPFEDGTGFSCPYRITGLKKEHLFYGAGVDAVQALLAALKNAAALLYTSEETRAGRLTWLGHGNLGLPVADAIADLVPPGEPSRENP